MMIKHGVWIAALAPVAAWAQLSLSGPVLGHVFDEKAQAVRLLEGVPGASRPGRLLDAGAALKAAYISSARSYALGLTAEDQTPVLLVFDKGPAQRFEDWKAGATGAVLSPTGSAAVLLYAEARRALVVSGLPDAPKLEREIELAGDLAALAVSDDAGRVLAAERDGRVTAFDAGDPVPLGGLEKITGLAFLSRSREAVAVSETLGEVYYLREDGHLILASAQEELGAPLAVVGSADRKRAYVALASGSIATFDLAGGPPSLTSCYCKPAALDPLASSGVFRLTAFSDMPMLLFDASGEEAKILFVPPVVEENEQ